jgi:hypothetical protein
VAVFQFEGFAAHGQRQQLMAQTDAKNRLAIFDKIFKVFNDFNIFGRIAWSV